MMDAAGTDRITREVDEDKCATKRRDGMRGNVRHEV
jgi:hypothetical protein